jgi:glycosyltransferase involved in cell wall biosynthesis
LELGAPRPLILHVGRITPPKDHVTLLDAFDRAWHMATGDARPILVLVAVGSPRKSAWLRRKIQRLASRDDVHLLPAQAELAPLYTDADIFALSSLWEARPYVLVEAMQYGCAVVSTDVGGVGEVVKDGETGVLVTPSHPEALACALYEVGCDQSLRKQLGDQAQRYVTDRYTLDDMIEQTLAVYRRVLRMPAL